MSESLWSIYNRAEEVRVDGLHAFQLRSILKSFAPHAFSSWLIWQEGWVDWQQLEAVADSLFPGIRENSLSVVHHSVSQMQPNSGVIAEQSPLTYAHIDLRLIKNEEDQNEVTPEVPTIESAEGFADFGDGQPALSLVETPMPNASAPLRQEKPSEDRRSAQRFDVPIIVFLHIDGTVVKNETRDISLGGMRLKNPIAKDPKTSLDVTMLYQGTELALRCKVLTSSDETTRTRLMIEKCNRIEILRSWIVGPKKESA